MPQGPAPDYNETVNNYASSFGNDSPLGDLKPLPAVSQWDAVQAQREREANASTGDYLHSMVRQDSPVDGFVANAIGAHMAPDPSFSPYNQKWYEEKSKGLPEDLKPQLLKATSENQATYIRERLDDKVTDIQRLGDMGVAGNAARFLAGLLEPTNLALGLVSGGAATLARGVGTAGRVAIGLGAGFGQGYGFERLRQAYNYEDSQPDAVWAGLMGTAFSAPFVGVHAAQMSRLRAIAGDELVRQNALRSGDVTPEAQAAHDRLAPLDAAHEQSFMSDGPAVENEPVKALPHYAGDPMVSFPDGTTMTGAEHARRVADGYTFEQHLHPNKLLADLGVEDAPHSDVPPEAAPAEPAVQPQPVNDSGVHATEPVQPPADLLGQTVEHPGGTGEVIAQHPDTLVVKDDQTGRPITVKRGDARALPSVDGFIPEGSVGGAQIKRVPMELTAMSKLRFDVYSFLNKSKNPTIQHLGNLMVKDAIGAVDAEGNQIAQRRSASEDKKVMQRVIGGGFHYEANSAYKEAARKLGYGWVQEHLPSRVRQFNEDVGRFSRDPTSFEQSPIKGELQRASTAQSKAMTTMLDEMQKAGVKGAETLKADPNYLRRMWKPEDIRTLEREHGSDEVESLFAKAINDKEGILARFREKNPESPKTDDEVLRASARKFISSVKRLEYSHLSHELLLTATDAPTLRAELIKANLSPSEANALIDNLFEVHEATSGDAGKPAELKYRFNLDEGAKHTTAAGATIHLHQAMENDVRIIVDRYMNTMAGHVAMARRGVKSRADFEALIREADAHHEEFNSVDVSGKQYGDESQTARDMYDHIVGRPMSFQSFNKGDRLATAFRAYGRSVYLGQLGFTAMLEVFHAASLMGWKNAFEQSGSLRQFWAAAKGGQVPDKGLARDVQQMLGFLNEHLSAYARQSEVTEHTYDRGLTRFENLGNELSHAVDHFSGNSFTTSITRGMAAAGFIQKYANLALGRGKLTESLTKRLIGSGVREADIPAMLEQLKQHVTMDGNRVDGVDWEGWSAKDPNSYHDFTTAVDRDTRQAIQDHDVGETWLFQHTSIGKVFTELRAFNIAAHSKQMLNAVHYKDRLSLMLFTNSLIANGMAYVAQTAMNYGHDPKELDKRLTMARISQAAYQRANMMGIMPYLTTTLWPGFATPSALETGNALTANTQSRNALMPPSFNLLSKAVSFAGSGNLKDGFSLLPFSNTYGARNLADMIGKYQQRTTP